MAQVDRRADVVWEGDISGSGSFSGGSGALENLPVTFASRTESSDGKTSPEELIASAHSTCYAMALSNVLGNQGASPERLEVSASCVLDTQQLRITTVDLEARGTVPGMSEDDFRSAAEQAEQLCPVSNALRGNVEIRLHTTLRV